MEVPGTNFILQFALFRSVTNHQGSAKFCDLIWMSSVDVTHSYLLTYVSGRLVSRERSKNWRFKGWRFHLVTFPHSAADPRWTDCTCSGWKSSCWASSQKGEEKEARENSRGDSTEEGAGRIRWVFRRFVLQMTVQIWYFWGTMRVKLCPHDIMFSVITYYILGYILFYLKHIFSLLISHSDFSIENTWSVSKYFLQLTPGWLGLFICSCDEHTSRWNHPVQPVLRGGLGRYFAGQFFTIVQIIILYKSGKWKRIHIRAVTKLGLSPHNWTVYSLHLVYGNSICAQSENQVTLLSAHFKPY